MPIRRLGTLILAILLVPAAIPVAKGSATAPNDAQAKIRAILRDQQEKQHIPGLSFVAVKDDKVWFIETMGLRDVAGKLPVTPDTVFPVGSCTKSFTSVAAGISQDRGILSLDDPPRRFLPWFRMADPEADALVTLRDMLCHRTGLKAYADLAAEPAVLTREEYIRAATGAKPTARFREKFQYSNAAFTAAGEAIARANQTTWEGLIESAILGPLGMTSSRTSTDAMAGLPDHALGYVYRAASKDWKAVPAPKSLNALAPAGAIVSSARDLGQWLRFLTSGGTLDGKRLLSEAALRTLTRGHVTVGGDVSYGLGWVNYRWNGHGVVEHNGGSQGICALVSFMPEKRVGFAVLGNTSPSGLTAIGKAGSLLWPLLVGETEAARPTAGTTPSTSVPAAKSEADRPAAKLPSVDDVFVRMIAAYGGERNLHRHQSMEIRALKDYENHGIHADVIIRASEPANHWEREDWAAAGRPIGWVRSYFDGARGGQETTFGQDASFAGDELEETRRKSTAHAILVLRDLYSQVVVDRNETIAGEETDVVKLTPKSGPPRELFVSVRTSLIVQEQTGGERTVFSDYRNIDGEVLSFRRTIHDALGETTIVVSDVRFNVVVSPQEFGPIVPTAGGH